MGKVVKAEIGKNEDQEEIKVPENTQETSEPAAEKGCQIELNLKPNDLKELMKDGQKKGFFDFIWKDRGVLGKLVTITAGAGVMTGVVIGIKALVGLLFGPEAAEMIDPSAIVPTEE